MKSNILDLIRDVVVYEQTKNQHEMWDIEATSRMVEPYVTKHLTGLALDDDWQIQEAVHLIALDWFSMFEPVWKKSNA